MIEILLIAGLSMIASAIGIITGFGTATIMVPVLLLAYSLPETLLLSGIVHWFGNIWKVSFFRSGVNWRLILAFGAPGLFFTWIGASLVFSISQAVLAPVLGVGLMLYTLFIFFNRSFELPARNTVAAFGGAVSGFMCGIFGVGGAIRGAFLSAFNLPKEVYIATVGFIGLIVDSGRLITYLTEGMTITSVPLWSVLVFVAASFVGAILARGTTNKIPQHRFRLVTMVFLFAIALRYTFF